MISENYKYDVAFSYAKADKVYVGEVANLLKSNELRVFFDDFEEEKIEMWGNDLTDYSHEIFSEKSLFTVIFISKEYESEKVNERKSAQQKQMNIVKKDKEYILPVKFDDTELKGIGNMLVAININKDKNSPEELARIIIEKVNKSKIGSGDKIIIGNETNTSKLFLWNCNRITQRRVFMENLINGSRIFILIGSNRDRPKEFSNTIRYSLLSRIEKYSKESVKTIDVLIPSNEVLESGFYHFLNNEIPEYYQKPKKINRFSELFSLKEYDELQYILLNIETFEKKDKDLINFIDREILGRFYSIKNISNSNGIILITIKYESNKKAKGFFRNFQKSQKIRVFDKLSRHYSENKHVTILPYFSCIPKAEFESEIRKYYGEDGIFDLNEHIGECECIDLEIASLFLNRILRRGEHK